jgi:hypothetical protein
MSKNLETYNPIGCEHRLPSGWTAYVLYSDESWSGPDFTHHVYTCVCQLCGTIKRGGHRATNEKIDHFNEEFSLDHPDAVAAIVKNCNYMNQETEGYVPFTQSPPQPKDGKQEVPESRKYIFTGDEQEWQQMSRSEKEECINPEWARWSAAFDHSSKFPPDDLHGHIRQESFVAGAKWNAPDFKGRELGTEDIKELIKNVENILSGELRMGYDHQGLLGVTGVKSAAERIVLTHAGMIEAVYEGAQEWENKYSALQAEISSLKALLEGQRQSSANIIDQNCRLVDERTRMLESGKKESDAAVATIQGLEAELSAYREALQEYAGTEMSSIATKVLSKFEKK